MGETPTPSNPYSRLLGNINYNSAYINAGNKVIDELNARITLIKEELRRAEQVRREWIEQYLYDLNLAKKGDFESMKQDLVTEFYSKFKI